MENQLLADCYVSEEYGFILQDPLDKLPEYYKPWMDIAEHLPDLIETKKLRDEVKSMPELDIQHLRGHRQLRLARVILSHMVMGHVWQNGETGGVTVLPRTLAVPYHQLSQSLGLPLIMVHADFVLANWRRKDPTGPLTIELAVLKIYPFDLLFKEKLLFVMRMDWLEASLQKTNFTGKFFETWESFIHTLPVPMREQLQECFRQTLWNMTTILSLPGGDSLQGFVLVTLLVEVAAIPAVKTIIQAVRAVQHDDTQALLSALQDMEQSINGMSEALQLMHDYVDSDVYYNTIRTFLSGWKNNPNMPGGLIYEGVSEEPLCFSGGSAAQSSVYHALDELLGIQHLPESADFLRQNRQYMLPAHRGFIKWVQEVPGLPAYVLRSEDPTLLTAFNQCISALTQHRSLHIRIVSKYVNVAGIRSRLKTSQDGQQGQEQQERGTGGSHAISFLKSVRDTCKEGMLRHSNPGDH